MVSLRPRICSVPTERPESDGTMRWDHTSVLVVQVPDRDGCTGLGYSYSGPGADDVVRELLEPALADADAADVGACWSAMVARARNAGRPGLVASAISAVDVGIGTHEGWWDRLARRLGVHEARDERSDGLQRVAARYGVPVLPLADALRLGVLGELGVSKDQVREVAARLAVG